MSTKYLKFEDEAAAIQHLGQFRIVDDQGRQVWSSYADGAHIYIFPGGVIHQPTGRILTTDDGVQYAEMAPAQGFHVNWDCSPLPAALGPFQIYPTEPVSAFG